MEYKTASQYEYNEAGRKKMEIEIYTTSSITIVLEKIHCVKTRIF